MIFRLFGFLALVLVGIAPLRAAEVTLAPAPLKIVFWNLQRCPGGDKIFNQNAKFRSARVEIATGKPGNHRPVVMELELPVSLI